MIALITKCPVCGKEREIHVHEHDYDSYKNGALIQEAFPYLSSADRESLVSGVCPDCWEDIFSVVNEFNLDE